MARECAPVGQLACQRDSYLRTLKTLVVACETKAKEFEILFQDTILFPAGGGQPSDSGYILYEDRQIPVLSITRRGLDAVHTISESLPIGAEVELFVDWSTRYDHMQQHTGQHLVSAICDSKKLPTLGWYLTKRIDQQPCFVEISRALTEEEMTELRVRTNQAISQQHPVSVRIVDAENADCDYIPSDYQIQSLGKLREIHIGDLDANFCCGTHLRNTTELRAICIVCQKPGKVKGNSRLFYFVGDRAIDYMTTSAAVLYNVRTALSTNIETVETNLAKVQEERKQLFQVVKDSFKELAADRIGWIEEQLKKHGKYVLVHSMTIAPDFSEFVQTHIKDICDAQEELTFCMVAVPKPSPQASRTEKCASYSILGNKASEIGYALSNEFKPNIKGGGSSRKWQGKYLYRKDSEANEFVRRLKDNLNSLFPSDCNSGEGTTWEQRKNTVSIVP